jgi:hypothetical protein
VELVDRGDDYVLSNCAKFLARDWTLARHAERPEDEGTLRAYVAEAWRFPLVDSWADGEHFVAGYDRNAVTFVYPAVGPVPEPAAVAVTGPFTGDAPVPLRRVGDTPYFAVTAILPKAEVHRYRFVADGVAAPDPLNPQQEVVDGEVWSRFFTQLCTEPLVLDAGQRALVERLARFILPFDTPEGEDAVRRRFDEVAADGDARRLTDPHRADDPLGVVNFIDKVLAREEAHRLVDYTLCLGQFAAVLARRAPGVAYGDLPDDLLAGLWGELDRDAADGWDRAVYAQPSFFLRILRRHTYQAAFAHPKYGGNAGGAGWAYLEERFTDAAGRTLFDWRRIMERPLGTSPDYHG